MSVTNPIKEPVLGKIPVASFRFARETRAQIKTILEVLKLSTETAAVQFCVNFAFEHLEDMAPRAARSGEIQRRYKANLAKLG